MAKFDAVDRLMQQATAKTSGSKQANPGSEPEEPATRAVPLSTQPSQLGGQQLAGVLQSLGPIFGTVLRRVNHPAAKAAAELLPLAGTVGARLLESGRAAATAKNLAPPPNSQMRAMLNDQQSALQGEIQTLRGRIDAQDEQLRHMRESLERTVAEQGTLAHRINLSADRSRLLSAGIVILLLLSVVQAVLLAIVLRR